MKIVTDKLYIYQLGQCKFIFKVINEDIAKVIKVLNPVDYHRYKNGDIFQIRYTNTNRWQELTLLNKVKYL